MITMLDQHIIKVTGCTLEEAVAIKGKVKKEIANIWDIDADLQIMQILTNWRKEAYLLTSHK
jgi:hypothetical protein